MVEELANVELLADSIVPFRIQCEKVRFKGIQASIGSQQIETDDETVLFKRGRVHCNVDLMHLSIDSLATKLGVRSFFLYQ